MSQFKITNDLTKRQSTSNEIILKYPDRIPIIIESYDEKKIKLEQNKFLVSRTFTFGQFITNIRQRIKIAPEKAIFLFVDNILPSVSESMENIYNKHRDIDGFLYLMLNLENCFGFKD